MLDKKSTRLILRIQPKMKNYLSNLAKKNNCSTSDMVRNMLNTSIHIMELNK